MYCIQIFGGRCHRRRWQEVFRAPGVKRSGIARCLKWLNAGRSFAVTVFQQPHLHFPDTQCLLEYYTKQVVLIFSKPPYVAVLLHVNVNTVGCFLSIGAHVDKIQLY